VTESDQPDVREQPGSPPLARSTLDRAAQHRKDASWLSEAWTRGLVLVVDLSKGGRALVTDRADGGVELVLLPRPRAAAPTRRRRPPGR